MNAIVANVTGSGRCEIRIAGGLITDVNRLGPEIPGEVYCSPGFVDLQLNGFAGLDFSASELRPEDIVRTLPALWATGCTTFFPTLITNSLERLERNFHVLERTRRESREFARCAPGYHLEGPYLSPGASRGAHDAAFMREARSEEFERLQKAAGGKIDILTLAPEIGGAIALTRHASQRGVVVAISHTDGTASDVHAAVAAGASLSTHWGNGCPPIVHRHQAPLWAQLASDGLCASIICDGFHLPREHIQIAHRVKGTARTILVTDAVHVAGMAAGRYFFVGNEIELLPGGQVVTVDGRSMAGSSLSMDRAVWNFMQSAAVPLSAALETATRSPAALLRRRNLARAVAPGEIANLAIFRLHSDRLEILRTLLAGEVVYEKPGCSPTPPAA
jgi:N-acetylglucosamine-6-phosphate deacetylase